MGLKVVTCVALLVAMTAVSTNAAKRSRAKAAPKDSRQVELFSAIKSGDIQVDFIPKDATVANLLIKNKTDKPLSIKLPAAVAGVPVLAQFGGGGFGGGGLGGGGLGGGGGGLGGGGGGQGLGGGLGGGGGGGGFGGGGGGGLGGGGGGGFFNVAPEKTGKIKVPCLCLEHGKPDPTPRMKYKVVPIETLAKDPKVIEVVKMLGRGEVPQNAAQAAAWNLANGMSWNELAAKNRIESRFTGNVRFFNPRELALAMQITSEASKRAKNATPLTSPGESSPGDEQSPDSNRVGVR
jgi:hypothetical protein